MKKNQDEDLIEKHLQGTLTQEEATRFEERKGDAAFSEMLLFQEDLQVAASRLGREQLKEQLKGLEQKRPQQPMLRVRWKRSLAVAATIMLLLLAGSAWYADQYFSNEALATAFYQQPNVSGEREAGQPTTFRAAANAFYEQDFASSIRLLKDELANTPDNEAAQLLLAHAYLKNKQAKPALAQLATLPETPDTEWLRILAQLQNDNTETAVALLNEIAKTEDHPYETAAKALLVQLSSGWRTWF